MSYLRIKELSKMKGVTGKELASRLNVTENAISLISNGKRQPRFELLSQIAEILDVDIRDLFHSTKDQAGNVQALYVKDEDGNFQEIGTLRTR